VFLWFNSAGARMCLAAMGPRPWISQLRMAREVCIAVKDSPDPLFFAHRMLGSSLSPHLSGRGVRLVFCLFLSL
jgi:hypothetical protein